MSSTRKRARCANEKLALSLVVAAVLAGCGENTPVQTVDWYKAHDAERKDMIAKCKSNPGELAASPNCINAQQAQNEKTCRGVAT